MKMYSVPFCSPNDNPILTCAIHTRNRWLADRECLCLGVHVAYYVSQMQSLTGWSKHMITRLIQHAIKIHMHSCTILKPTLGPKFACIIRTHTFTVQRSDCNRAMTSLSWSSIVLLNCGGLRDCGSHDWWPLQQTFIKYRYMHQTMSNMKRTHSCPLLNAR